MKIMFICGCLEPGRDGVGDYTRRIAIELIQQGHHIAAISLNDKYISEQFTGTQQDEGIDLEVLRLPSKWSLKKKVIFASRYTHIFSPDWLSLQFVVYGFQKKGLPVRLGSNLALLGLDKKWHIMFHELGIGNNIGASKKDRLIGFIQRHIIKRLVKDLKPLVVDTQTKLYQVQLDKMGVKSSFLPLFSNIPVLPVQDEEANCASSGAIVLVAFGTIHPNSLFEVFIKEAMNFSKENNIKLELRIIGKSGNELAAWMSICESEGLEFTVLGEQSPQFISKELSKATVGISTSDILRIEKSGTVSAFLAHGLPVICISKPWIPRALPNFAASPPKGVLQYEKGNVKACFNIKKNQIAAADINVTSKIFIEHLLSHS